MENLRLSARGGDEIVQFKALMAKAREALKFLPAESKDTVVFMEKLDTAEFFGTRALVSKPGNYMQEGSGE